jgi:hypothetical protein
MFQVSRWDKNGQTMASFVAGQAINLSSLNFLDERRLGLDSYVDSDDGSSTTTTPDQNPASLAHIRALQETCVNQAQNTNSGTSRVLFPPALESSKESSLTLKLEQLRISASAKEGNHPSPDADDDPSRLLHLSKKLPTRPALGLETFHPPGQKPEVSPSSSGSADLGPTCDANTAYTQHSVKHIGERAPPEEFGISKGTGARFDGMASLAGPGPLTYNTKEPKC